MPNFMYETADKQQFCHLIQLHSDWINTTNSDHFDSFSQFCPVFHIKYAFSLSKRVWHFFTNSVILPMWNCNCLRNQKQGQLVTYKVMISILLWCSYQQCNTVNIHYYPWKIKTLLHIINVLTTISFCHLYDFQS